MKFKNMLRIQMISDYRRRKKTKEEFEIIETFALGNLSIEAAVEKLQLSILVKSEFEISEKT